VIEHSSRLAEDQEKVTAVIRDIRNLLQEADYWAGEEGHELIEALDVQKALNMHHYHHNRAREAVYERLLRDTSSLATSGAAVGQINGLLIFPLGNFTYGAPDRITGRVRVGSGSVDDIDRQVNFASALYGKAVLLLTAYLKNHLAAERPFSLAATLSVDGTHTAIDGNSASSAELYVLLSALANVPLKQSFAVTGAVSQWGEVLAIGRVNDKIESFIDICKARGLTGEQGVLIPKANARDLMLRADVVEAAAAEQFHIYAVSTIDEGITLLTGIPAGEPDEDGEYPEDTINGRVIARLLELDEKQRSFGNSSKNNNKTAADKPEAKPEDDEKDDEALDEEEEIIEEIEEIDEIEESEEPESPDEEA
jgi:predicted ATP-dependent protease